MEQPPQRVTAGERRTTHVPTLRELYARRGEARVRLAGRGVLGINGQGFSLAF